ncbi:MAG: flavin reductase [Saprospiraceae bacterium]|nr:flavin reductase [Saprospiraceae bacterium]
MVEDDNFVNWIELDTSNPIWGHFFTVSPLVVVGTKENDGYDLAPKHMAMPLGLENYFGFICTPNHGTYHNVKREGFFTVSFPRPNQVVMTSLAATPRDCGETDEKPIVYALPTVPATAIDGILLRDSYLFFECALDRIIDGFGEYSLIAGRIIKGFVHEDAYRVSDGDDEKMIRDMPLLAYLPYDRFAEIKDTRQFPYPKGFK